MRITMSVLINMALGPLLVVCSLSIEFILNWLMGLDENPYITHKLNCRGGPKQAMCEATAIYTVVFSGLIYAFVLYGRISLSKYIFKHKIVHNRLILSIIHSFIYCLLRFVLLLNQTVNPLITNLLIFRYFVFVWLSDTVHLHIAQERNTFIPSIVSEQILWALFYYY
jgi:hypothetical protein